MTARCQLGLAVQQVSDLLGLVTWSYPSFDLWVLQQIPV